MEKKRGNQTKEQQAPERKFLQNIVDEEQLTLERIRELIHLLRMKHGLSQQQLLQVLNDKEIFIPLTIFTKKLSILEAVVKYLKEELNVSYHQIGIFLQRNERNIWHTYQHAKKKYPAALPTTPAKFFLPVSLFQNDLSMLENVAVYGKDTLQLKYRTIAQLIERNERTVWTMYHRAKKKLGVHQ